jgi:streptogramin lyase
MPFRVFALVAIGSAILAGCGSNGTPAAPAHTATPTPKPTVSATPSATPTATSATPTPAPTATPVSAACTGSHLYVNDDFGGVFRYSLPLTSSSVGTNLQSASYNVWIAFDPECNLYLTAYFGAVQKFVSPYTGTAVASYGGSASSDPYGVAVNASGNVFVAEAEANKVVELASIAGTVTTTIPVAAPYALALDSSGNLYVGGSGGVSVYAPPYTGAPTKTIATASGVGGIAFDSSGNLFVGANDTVTVYAPPYGPSNVTATITNGVNAVLGLAVDASGNVYVPNYGGNTITAYAPPYTGAPFATIPGSLPDGAAIGP